MTIALCGLLLLNSAAAFVAMNPPRTPPAEAAACVKEFVYPYHYRGQNTQEFASALKNTGIEVRLRNPEGKP
jgi:hypothetical protein